MLGGAADRLAAAWESEGRVARLWAGDASVWSGADEADWLGWLRIVPEQLARTESLQVLQREIDGQGFTHALLMGMGGSSLCPEALRSSFGRIAGAPDLLVLDSTDPAQVRAVDERLDYRRTLFIVSSKSGATLETDLFLRRFAERARQELGGHDGSRFMAITDPGSPLDSAAAADRFRFVRHGVPDVGGRFSALSDFGLAPAAVMRIDVARLLGRAEAMRSACLPSVPVRENPGVMLGLALAAAARAGRDKVTFVISPQYRGFGAWLEQLLAESTGKNGVGLVPVEGEDVGAPELYGDDRIFVYLRDRPAPCPGQDEAVTTLERAGHPVVRLDVQDPYDLGAEFFRWEFATAVAGSVLGINPFDQPDVEASKVETRRLTAAYETGSALPSDDPIARDGHWALHADRANAAALRSGGRNESVESLLAAHWSRAAAGDYLALLAYVEMSAAHAAALQRVRRALRAATRVATCVGFGPRLLHSTGQLHKGGPNRGVFLQITCDDEQDAPIPGRRYGFGAVKAAQAQGDYQALADRGRRAVRLHVTGDPREGLRRLADLAGRIGRR